MQYKHNNLDRLNELRLHERAMAVTIAGSLVLGAVAVSHEARRAISEFAAHPVMAVIEHSNRETEVAHRAMRFDSVMPADPISGE